MRAKTLAERIAQTDNGRIRTLIIGAGIAGLTLACLMRQRGERPHIIERLQSLDDAAGYNLGLYPLGSRVLHGLGLYDRLRNTSVTIRYYELGNGAGKVIRRYDFSSLLLSYGPLLGVRRAELLQVLRLGLGGLPIHFGETVEAVIKEQQQVTVRFADGSFAAFDLVVGADGIHSATRSIILRPEECARWDMGWGCWICWADEQIVQPETAVEFWGSGFLIGIYPVKDAQGVVVAGPRKALERYGRKGVVGKIRSQLKDFSGPIPAVLEALEREEKPFYWDLQDSRCTRWFNGRVVLLGDAAQGFLPTAGVGASVAMVGASILADELARTDVVHLEHALQLFYQRARPKIEAAQANSRRLARIMAVESPMIAWGREKLARFYTLDRALSDITKVMEGSI
jgi:2-polyprenyl-6-methoxyphenol hydroxylase-like FAD-dependent oxidoreductase